MIISFLNHEPGENGQPKSQSGKEEGDPPKPYVRKVPSNMTRASILDARSTI